MQFSEERNYKKYEHVKNEREENVLEKQVTECHWEYAETVQWKVTIVQTYKNR